MKTNLLGLVVKIIIITLAPVLILTTSITQEKQEIKNINKTKNSLASVTKINYTTQTIYNSNIKQGTKITKQEGKQGLAYTDENHQIIKIIEPSKEEIIEVGTKEEESYVGKLTGYGANCTGCTGNLSCKTENNQTWNLTKDGQVYNDKEYGQVRILAAALEKFPCGTIVEINTNSKTILAIILDTGSAMQKDYQNGIIHMDLAFTLEETITNITNNNVKYTIKRLGW